MSEAIEIPDGLRRISQMAARIQELESENTALSEQLTQLHEGLTVCEQEKGELEPIAERLEVLAVKWVDAVHHDWQEIKELIRRKDELTATQPEEE